MAWVNLISDSKWTDSSIDPSNNHLSVSYESNRSGNTMQYRFQFVYSIGSQSWYDWGLFLNIWLDNQIYTPTALQIKAQTNSRVYGWRYTVTTDWYSVQNKVSGTTSFKFTTFGIESSYTKNKLTYTKSLPVIEIGNPTLSSLSISNIIVKNDGVYENGHFELQAKATVSSIGTNATSITSRNYKIYKGNSTSAIASGSWVDNTNIKTNISLDPNTAYKVSFTATNNANLSTTKSITVTTPKIDAPTGKPIGLSILPAPILSTTRSLTLTWKKPATGRGTSIGNFGYMFNVFRASEGSKSYSKINKLRAKPNGDTTTYYWISDSRDTITISQNSWGISSEMNYNVGDKLYFSLVPYIYYNNVFYTSDVALLNSSTFVVVSDQASLKVATTSGWKQGKVYLKDGNTWKPAKAIWIKNGNTWVKSK